MAVSTSLLDAAYYINTTSDYNNNSNNITAEEIEPMGTSEKSTLGLTEFILYGIVGNILVVLGLFGNTLSIVVLCNRRMRSSTSYYLTSLAVYDNAILVAMLLFFNFKALGYREDSVTEFNNRFIVPIVPVGYPLSLTAQMGSIYTCVAFTVERFVAVCRPLHAANTCTKSRAKKAILVIFLWSLLYNVPRFFHYQLYRSCDSGSDDGGGGGDASTTSSAVDGGRCVNRLATTPFGQDEVYRHLYIISFQLVFMFLLPFVVILVLNTALLRAINRSRQQRQQMSTTDTREHNLTVMLVAVIAVFLVCQFPTIIDNILVAIVGEVRHKTVFHYQLLYIACTVLVTINSSLNFILYCLFGKKFRMVLCHILRVNKKSGRGRGCQYRSTIYQSRANGCTNVSSHCNTYDMEVSLV